MTLLSEKTSSSGSDRRPSLGEKTTLDEYRLILSDFVKDKSWDDVMDTLNVLTTRTFTTEAEEQLRSHLFRCCLQASCLQQPTLPKYHDPKQQPYMPFDNNKEPQSSSSQFSPTTHATTDIPSQIMQLQILAGIAPNSVDMSLLIFHQCRRAYLEKRNGWRKAWNLLQHYQTAIKTTTTTTTSSEPLPIQVYDAVLTCMAEQGKQSWRDALRLLRYLEENNTTSSRPTPTVSTYRLVIETCVNAEQPDAAVRVLKSAVRCGITPSLYSFELVIGLLCSDHNNAHNAAGDNSLPYERNDWRQALQLLDWTDQLSVPKTLPICNAVLVAMSRAGEVAQAKNLLNKMMKKATIPRINHNRPKRDHSDNPMELYAKPNVVSYNSVIAACIKAGRWEEALKYSDLCLRAPGVRADTYTYTHSIRACAKLGRLDRALSLWQVAKDRKLPLDAHAYTSIIHACSIKQQQTTSSSQKNNYPNNATVVIGWTKALELLQEMENRNIQPTEVTYSAVIHACGNAGQWEKALSLFDQMKLRQHVLVPSRITYNGVLTALSRAAKLTPTSSHPSDATTTNETLDRIWAHADRLLQEMEFNGIEKDGFTYSAALSCCHNKWEQALQLIEQMRKVTSTVPNKIAYTAAIVSCGKAGQVHAALDLFQNMKNDGILSDCVAYNALFDAIRASSGSRVVDPMETIKIVSEMWEEMVQQRQSGFRKLPHRISPTMNAIKPDMITLTNAIGALLSIEFDSNRDLGVQQQLAAVDRLYSEAVKLGVTTVTLDPERNILESSHDLISPSWKVDLSGLSFPVARAACRHVFQRIHQSYNANTITMANLRNLIFLTGVGSNKESKSKTSHLSLRDYIQEILLGGDFIPPMESQIPSFAPGTVQISSEMIQYWVQHQQRQQNQGKRNPSLNVSNM